MIAIGAENLVTPVEILLEPAEIVELIKGKTILYPINNPDIIIKTEAIK